MDMKNISCVAPSRKGNLPGEVAADANKWAGYKNLSLLAAKTTETVLDNPLAEALDLRRDKLGSVELERKIGRLYSCATALEYRRSESSPWRLHGANFCRQPEACPTCAKRLQGTRVARFRDVIIRAAQKYRYAYFVTLTIKNGPNLREREDHLRESMVRLRKMGQRRGKKFGTGQWSKIAAGGAGIFAIEIKRGKGSGLWHPHAHGLFFCDERIEFSPEVPIYRDGEKFRLSPMEGATSWLGGRISADWVRATGGDSCNVDVRRIEARGSRRSEKWAEDVFSQCLEIFKYSTKLFEHIEDKVTPFTDSEAWNLDVATVICSGFARRRFMTYGQFRCKESDIYAGPDTYDAPEEDSASAPERRFARWNWVESRYCAAEKSVSGSLRPSMSDGRGRRYLQLQARILGKYRRRKYRILALRPHLSGRLDVLDRLLADNVARQSLALASLRDLRGWVSATRLGDYRRTDVWQVRRAAYEIARQLDFQPDAFVRDFVTGITFRVDLN